MKNKLVLTMFAAVIFFVGCSNGDSKKSTGGSTEAENAIADTENEFEDPRAVAERMKIEQQKREKERAERERAERLKADRQRFESKPFRQIYKEYSRNPIYAIPRLIRYLCAILFGWIPEDTDDPDLKAKRARLEAEKQAEKEALAAAKAQEKANRAKLSAARSVGRSTAGTLGREAGGAIGKTFLGSFGKRIGGNVGAALGRGLLDTLFKK